jgi:ureidoacrylate peracid hydrolase
MHKIDIPQDIIDRVTARRGREHIFDDTDPARTALVVIDLQNGFMMPGVAHSLCEMAPKIVPNVNRIAQTLRTLGGSVVWVQNRFTDETRTSWSVAHAMTTPDRVERRANSMREGSLGHRLWAELDVQPTDLIVQKERFSAFIQGSSDLEATLRARGIDTIVVCGTVTNVCCESTARDAMMRNFRVIFMADGNAAQNDAEHNASLIALYLTFADVMTTDFLVSCLEKNATRQAAE